MARRAKPHWDKREQAWRTDVGGRTKYFRGIARADQGGAAKAFGDYLSQLVREASPPRMDALDLAARFVEASRGVKPKTATTHAERLAKWCQWPAKDDPGCVGLKAVDDLKASDLTRPLAAWKAAGLSDHYRAGICRSVKAAFAWGASEEGGRLVASSPFAGVKGPAVERSPERYATRKEVADFLRFAWRKASASTPLYRRFGRLLVLMVRVGAHTGTRPGDLCCAWWQDFDARKGTITLPPDRHKTGDKTGRPLVIFLGKTLTRALCRQKAVEGRHPVAIFSHKRGRGGVARGAEAVAGEPWGDFVTRNGRESFEDDSTPLSQAIRKLRIGAIRWQEARRADAIARGVPASEAPPVTIVNTGDNRFVFYRLRHTVASDFLMRGGASATVAELLGTSPKMLETTYGHLLEDHLADASERLRARPKSGAAD